MNDLMTAIENFHFLRPWWLLGILLVIAVYVALQKRQTHAGQWRRVISPTLLPHLLRNEQHEDSRLPWKLLLAAGIIASIALAGPTWRQLPSAVQKKIDARVVVFDLTLSMYAPDVAPSRLVRAKYKLSDLLKRSREGLTGLVVFAGTAHVASPLTDDSNTILAMVESLTPDIMPTPGSDPVSAIKAASKLLASSGSGGDILFIGDDLPADTVNRLEPWPANVRLDVLGVGTSDGAPIPTEDGRYLKDASGSVVMAGLDENRLRNAAAALGGRYSLMTADDADLDYLLAERLGLEDETRDTQRKFDTWEDTGGWLVLLILPLAAASYRRGWLTAWWLAIVLAGLMPAREAVALGPDWLWHNADQRGKQAWDADQYDKAAEAFDASDWKAAALYRQKKWKEAEALYSTDDSADGHYNRGNTLAQQGRLQDAIDAYEQSLQRDPGHADALKNRDIVAEALKQQQQASGGDQGAQSPQQDGDQKKDGQQDEQGQEQKQQGQPQDQPQDQPPGSPSGAPPESGSQGQQSDRGGQPPEGPQGGSSPQSSSPPPDGGQEADQEAGRQEGEAKEHDEGDAGAQAEREKDGMNDTDRHEAPQRPADVNRPLSETEDQQALQQWLRRIPDDPGGLLRNKFYFESQLRKNTPSGDTPSW
jgi:Ca-activated chloride channel family protein